MKKLLVFLLCLPLAGLAAGQQKYWIYLGDKKAPAGPSVVSQQTLANRARLGLEPVQSTDWPLDKGYLDSLRHYRATAVCQSRWLNAISAFLLPGQVESIRALGFVADVVPVNRGLRLAGHGEAPPVSPAALAGINGNRLQAAGLTGKGVRIGIIDGRFWQADRSPALRHVFAGNRMRGYRDYVSPGQPGFFAATETDADWHGSNVWQLIGGLHPETGVQYGAAPGATYFLARTDNGQAEFRGEEDYWIAAVEWMDSLGVQVINSSIVYSLDYDDPKQNYRPGQMNGTTSAIAKAAGIAVSEKGIIVVAAAGNDGENTDWKIIATPADAPGVITVGATDPDGLKPGYSGVGPDFIAYLKPNVACFTTGGTSFSAPVITGLIACMLEKEPGLDRRRITDLLEKSAHLYPYGNNYLGYGVPDAGKVLRLLDGEKEVTRPAKRMVQRGAVARLDRNAHRDAFAVVFHKRDERTLISQEKIMPENDVFLVRKPKGAVQSTVSFAGSVLEIDWQQEQSQVPD